MNRSPILSVFVLSALILAALEPVYTQNPPAQGGATPGAAPQGQPPAPQAPATPAPGGAGRGGPGGAGGPGAEGAGRGGREGAPAAAAPLPKGTFALQTAGYVVANLDNTLKFYRDVFGLVPYGSVPPRPLMNQAYSKLSNTTGGRYRTATLRLPNSGLLFRLMEVGSIERTPRTAQSVAEPGVGHMRLEVTDVELVASNLQRVGARFVAPATAQAAKTATTIFVRDPDGNLLEIAKGVGSQGSNIGAGASPVLDSRVVLTTASTDAKVAFYKDLLDAPLTVGTQWQRMPIGGNAEAKSTLSGDIGGPGRVIEMREYRNAGSVMPFKPRLQDPGAFVLSFFVRDLAELTKLIQAQKLAVITPDAQPVTLANLQRLMVQDPDGVFVELIQE